MMAKRVTVSLAALLLIAEPAFGDGYFYGHPTPTVSADVAQKEWQSCIIKAAAKLDDFTSPVMDIAIAIQPLCSDQEVTMNDAINEEFLAKNPGLNANMSWEEMEKVRQNQHMSLRPTIGSYVLMLRKHRK